MDFNHYKTRNMKKIFLLIALLLIIKVDSRAQGNLQFNQVLTFQGYIPFTAGGWQGFSVNGPQWTVPQNKVWKIESKSRTPDGSLRFMINGFSHSDLYERNFNNNYFALAVDNSPIWIKENDVINFNASGSCNGYGCQGSVQYSISIIEYNIVP